MRTQTPDPLAFLGWCIAGPLFVFGAIDASVGGPVGLVALVTAFAFGALAAWRSPLWPDALGAVVGCGGASIAIGYAHRPYYEVCPDGEPVQERVGDLVVSIASCPYIAPAPWLLGDGVVLVGGTAAYLWARAKARPRQVPDETHDVHSP